jgi:hypothetical protein
MGQDVLHLICTFICTAGLFLKFPRLSYKRIYLYTMLLALNFMPLPFFCRGWFKGTGTVFFSALFLKVGLELTTSDQC